MFRKMRFLTAVVFAAFLAGPTVRAQISVGAQSRPRIAQGIDEASRVALKGNTRLEAVLENDRGAVAVDFAMDHMLLELKRSPEK